MNHLYERTHPVEESLRIAEETASAFNVRTQLVAFGTQLQTFRCQIIDDQYKTRFYGFGKGIGMQSKASAYFEALEHYALHRFAQKQAENQQHYVKLPAFEAAIPCVKLYDMHAQEALIYPIFMLDPRYAKNPAKQDTVNYSTKASYANDSGVASGTNFIEASIHALNELIERDAHSLFLLNAFVKPKPVRLIDKTSLPIHLATIVNLIETEFNDDLMLFDITSDIGVPVMYVSMTQQPWLIQPSGCGASLRAEYALERALLEVLQPVHIQNSSLHANQQKIIDALTPYPLLLKAAIADTNTVDYETAPFQTSYQEPLTLEAQLQSITQKIETIGAQIYRLPIIESVRGFNCVKFFIPALEQFHLVQTGKRILPNARGRKVLQ